MSINPRTLDAYNLLHYGILALSKAEQQGMRVDIDYVQKKMTELTIKIDKLEAEFKDTNFFKHWEHSSKTTVNIDSNFQLGHFLYNVKKLTPPKLTDAGKGSTDEESLLQLNIPELNLLLERDKLKRLRDVNLDGFAREQVNGYIHPFFNLHLVRTFRSSSDSPNFQNIPKRDEESMQICRRALYPRPGHQFLEIDYSGLEVRIAACYHKDTTMLKYITNPESDMHRDMAQQLFMIDKFDKNAHNILRQAAKNGFVFPEFYGDYFKNCAINMACNWGKLPQGKWKAGQGIPLPEGTLSDHFISKGIKELGEIKKSNGKYVVTGFMKHVKDIEADFWGNRFQEYAEWKERWYNVYRKHGYLDTLTGFRCSGVMGKNDTINYPVQGSAFHCLLWSFIELDQRLFHKNMDTKLVSQIHDSIILDVNPAELNFVTRLAKRVTCVLLPQAWEWIIVPLDIEMELCEIDAPWSEKKKFIADF
jgi:DNA polymerase I-like protein with 3'-5' exonuclease and polymerase domains